MELRDFRKDFIETARALAVTEGDFEEASFVSEAARRLVEAEELEDFEPCHFEGTGSRQRKMRVDGYCFDEVDGSVSLIVANYEGSETDLTLTQTDATKHFEGTGSRQRKMRVDGYCFDEVDGSVSLIVAVS